MTLFVEWFLFACVFFALFVSFYLCLCVYVRVSAGHLLQMCDFSISICSYLYDII